MTTSHKGIALAVASAVAFGWLAIFTRMAYIGGSEPITVLALRFALSSAVMVGLMAFRRESFPRGRWLLALIGMGAIGYVGDSFFYFTALTYASTSLVALLLYVYPALVALLSALLFKEKISRAKWGAIGLAFAGTALTIGDDLTGQPIGVALGLAAALVYAGYIIASGPVMKRVSPVPASTVILLSSGVVYVALALARGPQFPTTLSGWAGIVCLAIVSTVFAVLAFLASVERIGASNAAVISTFEPVVTVALAVVLFDETLTLSRVVGGALILIAVAWLARAEFGAGRVLPPPE